MRSSRGLLGALGVLALLVVAAAVLLPARGGDPRDTRFSGFRSAPTGALALRLSLEQLGIPILPRLTPLVDADSLRGPLLLLAPSASPSPAELHALADWVRAGGALVYAARPGDATMDTLGLAIAEAVPNSSAPSGISARPIPDAWTVGVGEVSGFHWTFADSARALHASSAKPLLRSAAGEVAVVRYSLGAGTVVAWSDPAPLRNSALRESGAATLFARSAAALSDGAPLVWDEYHHGYRGGGSAWAATLRFLRTRPAGHVVLQLLLVGAGLLWLLGRRFGSTLPAPPARRRSPLEHVDALAAVYRQAGARRTARALLMTGVARRLGNHTPAEADPAAWLRRVSTGSPARSAAARALAAEWDRGDAGSLAALATAADQLLSENRNP